jgi:hypothetical protein
LINTSFSNEKSSVYYIDFLFFLFQRERRRRRKKNDLVTHDYINIILSITKINLLSIQKNEYKKFSLQFISSVRFQANNKQIQKEKEETMRLLVFSDQIFEPAKLHTHTQTM